MQALRQLYLKDWFRIPLKFVGLFALTKLGYDYYEYRSAFRWRRPNPRFCSYDEQSPAAPHLPLPYPYYSDWQGYQEIKQYYALQNAMQRKWMNWQDRHFLLVDLPCRENPNAVDQLLMRAKQFASSETIKFYLLS